MPKPMLNFTEKQTARFWSRVAKGTPTECWEWQGYYFGSLGYGGVKLAGKSWYAHRIAYYLYYGKDPGEHCVCHKCDNPKCCNPKHLWLGTQSDNEQDKVQKGRWVGRDQRGSKNVLAKLTDEKVREIRRLYATGECTQAKLAEQFSVSYVAISYIVRRKTWAHIK